MTDWQVQWEQWTKWVTKLPDRKLGKTINDILSVLYRVSEERDAALDQLNRIAAERDELREVHIPLSFILDPAARERIKEYHAAQIKKRSSFEPDRLGSKEAGDMPVCPTCGTVERCGVGWLNCKCSDTDAGLDEGQWLDRVERLDPEED
jgi:hypothetical protein